MQIFDHEGYKSFVLQWVKTQPHNGRGQYRRLALALRSSPVVVSQVFKGSRELTLEQALGTARFLGLSESETEYFLLLVQKARAGTHELATLLARQLKKIKDESKQIGARISYESFGDEARALFYSSWVYSATRLGLVVPGVSPHALAEKLSVDRTLLMEVLDFLLKHGLLLKKKGEFVLGPTATHVGHDHPLVERHHTNWRLRALDSVKFSRKEDLEGLHYTGPMVISRKLAEELRNDLMNLVEKTHERIREAPNEQVHCLTVDLFRIS